MPDVLDQLAPDALLPKPDPKKCCVTRFHEREPAEAVLRHMRRLTNHPLLLWFDTEPDPKDTCGNWCIIADGYEPNIFDWSRLSTIASHAIQYALAEALRKANPRSPMLTIYHLREEFRPYFYHFPRYANPSR